MFDEAEQPIEFATVRILGTNLGTNTDVKGLYELTVAEADTIMVEFSCVGYSTVTRQLIKPKGQVTISPKLYEKKHELAEVTITEYKKQTNIMQGIDIDKIRITPDVSGSGVEAVISTMAGVTSKNEMSSQYMVRGGSYDENSVYINGIEVYRPQLVSSGQQEGLSIINPDMVSQVNFSTGGFNAEYGDKMSSALDITYRDPQAVEGAFSASLQGASLALGHGTKKFSQ
ncbi:MAG: carboxypeptidase-like regulatory domain-containing protein, partial [Shewanella sp.]|nr:carboxypeptidase-like regulatory domain-containing protein [Shewanella sp.]